MKEIVKKFEYGVFTCTLLLVVFGLFVLYSASYIYSNKTYNSNYYLLIRQMIFCVGGIIIMLMLSFINYKLYFKFSNYIFILCLCLVIVTTFAGKISRGSSRWIELRGIIFQPSEFMKVTMMLHLSKVLSESYEKMDKKDVFLRVMLVAYVPTFIVALNNLSTGLILFFIATIMIFLVSKKKLIFLFIVILIVLFYIFAYPMTKVLSNVGLLKNYQIGRIFAWKAPEEYPDIAYQTLQGIYGVGSGKLFGRGYLNSIQKSLIPEVHNDMIFSVLCEELGLIGALLFLALYIFLIYRIIVISRKQNDLMVLIFTYGVAIHIAIQVIFNIGVVTNLLPNTGVTLPFVSYGGSSLIVLFVELGIVMSISKKI